MDGKLRPTSFVLFAILGLGATLRLWTIGDGLPYLPSVDEPVIFNRVAEMMKTGDLHPHVWDYGGLIFYVHLAIAWVRFAAGSLTGSMPPLAQVAASDFYLWGRIATALVGTATIYVVYRAASRWGLAVGFVGSGIGVAYALGSADTTGWPAVLLGQPAAWSVPLAFGTMVGVSLATRSRVPAHVQRFMVRLHTPEAVALDRG